MLICLVVEGSALIKVWSWDSHATVPSIKEWLHMEAPCQRNLILALIHTYPRSRKFTPLVEASKHCRCSRLREICTWDSVPEGGSMPQNRHSVSKRGWGEG